MKTPAGEIIHLVIAGTANPGMNDVNSVVHQLALQQALAGRLVSVWTISANPGEEDTAPLPYDARIFKKQDGKFKIDPDLTLAIGETKEGAIFHFHGGFVSAFFTISTRLHKESIPFVFTPHGAYDKVSVQGFGFMKSIHFKFFEKKILERATCIHCLGKTEDEGLQALYPNTKTIVVPYGFSSESSIQSAPDKNKFILGFCGRLDIYPKGLDLLVNAFAFVKQVNPRAQLWIIGDSAERDQLKRQIHSRGLQDDVIMWGSRSGEEKMELLSKINMFVHPSRTEGLAFSVIEAASMGIPCIVSEATTIGTTIRNFDCGEVVSNPDETDLFNAIMNLHHRIKLDGPASFSSKAKDMVAREYNWHSIVLRFDSLYEVA
ncbi:MAG: glycosyltransferase family 4 protein [Chitinophagaceae bacterium]